MTLQRLLIRSALRRVDGLLGRLSLHTRVAVLVSVMLIAVFVALGYVGWTAVSQAASHNIAERRAIAQSTANYVDDWLRHALADIGDIAATLPADTDPLDSAAIERALRRSSPRLGILFSRIHILDGAGHLVASAPTGRTPRFAPPARAAVDAALASNATRISDLVPLPTEQSPGILLSAPVERRGTLRAVVVAELPVPPSSIEAVLRAIDVGRAGNVKILDANGDVIASTRANEVGTHTEYPSFYRPPLAARRAEVGLTTPDQADENATIQAFAPLQLADWGISVGQTDPETLAAVRDLRSRTLAVATIAIVVALGAARLGTRSIVGPVMLLTRASERMAAGDLTQPVPLAQPDEVGRLAGTLETMRRRLNQSLTEVTVANHELEQRVSARTADLFASNRRLGALVAVATAANRGDPPIEVLAAALRELRNALVVSRAWAYLQDRDGERVRLAWQEGTPAPVLQQGETDDADHLPALCSPCGTDAAPCVCAGDGRSADPIRRCCVTIRVGDQPLGVIGLGTAGDRELTPDELALLRGISQQVAFAFESARHVGERARLEAARRLEILRGEFLASVSHELRTPLGLIKGHATTLLRDDIAWNAEQQREFLGVIDEECERLDGLIGSLLEAARIHTGRLQLRCARLAPEQFVRDIVARLGPSLAGCRVALRTEPTGSIVADASRLRQVLANLLHNAAKFSPNGGEIEIQLAAEERGVRIAVLDRGLGIPADEAARVFEPFYRVRHGRAAGIEGTGLGLAICRSVVEAHGGRIWAEAREGGGTVVILTLPWQPERVTKEGADDAATATARG